MTRAGIAIATLASIAAATVVTGSNLTRADATDGAQPNTSCATTTACLEGDNTSTGPGVKGTSTKGHGVVGTTKAKGTTSSHAGVLGQDLQTGGGKLNVGVEGTSTNGIAVFGLSTNFAGVVGESTTGLGVSGSGTTGVFGDGTVGMDGFGSNEGVEGDSSTSGDAFFANGIGGLLFRGNNSQSQDVFLVDDAGDVLDSGAVESVGAVISDSEVAGLTGVFGDPATVNVGLNGEGLIEGVVGTNSATGDAIFADGFGGDLFRGNNSQGSDVFVVDDAGDVFANNFFLKVAPGVIQPTSDGRTVRTYGTQATMPTIEDVGEAQLVNGVAHVALDRDFAAAIDPRSGYIVSITPEGITQGVLCVTQRTASGFTVQENMAGHSSVPFSYRLTAKPYGSNAPRLPAMVVPAHFDRPMPKKVLPVRPRVPAAKHHAKPARPRLASLHA